MRRIILYGLAGGLLIAILKFIEYRHFVRVYPAEIYGGLIAAIFAGVGIWFGMGLRRTRIMTLISAGVLRRRGTEATAGVA